MGDVRKGISQGRQIRRVLTQATGQGSTREETTPDLRALRSCATRVGGLLKWEEAETQASGEKTQPYRALYTKWCGLSTHGAV